MTDTALATQGDRWTGQTARPTVTTPDDLRRLAAESRVRLATVEDLRVQQRLIAEHSRRRLDASRLLLDRRVHAWV